VPHYHPGFLPRRRGKVRWVPRAKPRAFLAASASRVRVEMAEASFWATAARAQLGTPANLTAEARQRGLLVRQ
jgi:hypothetical protein